MKNKLPVNESFNCTFDNFIGKFDNVFYDDFLEYLIEYCDKSQHVIFRKTKNIEDKVISFNSFNPNESSLLMGGVNECLIEYVKNYPCLSEFNFVSTRINLQITEPPTGGFHNFHAENIGWSCRHRTLVWMVYLNDVKNKGETEFYFYNERIKPVKGTVLIWPGGFTHLHRGNPPGERKYIATGWYQADQNNTFNDMVSFNKN
jgi:hypothetical protein